MNKNVYIILLLIMNFFTLSLRCKTKFPFQEQIDQIQSFFQGSMIEKIDQKEISATTLTSLSISNTNGSITIKTGPKKSLFVRTITKAKKEEQLDNIEVVIDASMNNQLAIATENRNQKSVGSVDYELIVPKSLALTLSVTGTGTVYIKDVHGTITVVANDSITLINTKKAVSARSCKKGSILITNASGPVEAHTNQGDIIGENIAHSFTADTTSGKVDVAYKKVPSASSINLTTTSGNIILALPTGTNAAICGCTTYGTLLSEHDITLKSYTTKLNKSAWTKFTKEVDGILGTGDATIDLHTTKGNVKILETKIT